MLLYLATIKRDGNSFTLIFPDVPGAHTNGDSREDALAHAPDALHTAISMLIEKNLDIPAPSKARRKGVVLVGASLGAQRCQDRPVYGAARKRSSKGRTCTTDGDTQAAGRPPARYRSRLADRATGGGVRGTSNEADRRHSACGGPRSLNERSRPRLELAMGLEIRELR